MSGSVGGSVGGGSAGGQCARNMGGRGCRSPQGGTRNGRPAAACALRRFGGDGWAIVLDRSRAGCDRSRRCAARARPPPADRSRADRRAPIAILIPDDLFQEETTTCTKTT
ncbi:hypothetical protein C7S16_5306 [Burkholderia thailandensis]|uniref:Uncharacterized protein n=1 Tax=Burkholderia thailandensis TaxID=57975 RepID=A0AAW9D0P1_BURTH|nr:hypothetical protein [Burkholderia thailandensis]MDW9253541.1 hypothetical protein [Burkholderia thailandensis]